MTDPTTPAPLDLAALRKIAEAATRGPWWTGQHSLGARKIDVMSDGGWHMPKTEADAAHIAAFDPPTVLQLIELARDAETWKRRYTKTQTVLSKMSDRFNGEPCAEIRWQQEREAFIAERDAMKAERDALKARNENPCVGIFDHKWLDPECVDGGCKSLVLAQKLARSEELTDKYKWQVRDTCTRAEKADAELASLRALLVRAGEDVKCKITEAGEQCARHAPMGGINYLSWFGRLIGLKDAITRATQTGEPTENV